MNRLRHEWKMLPCIAVFLGFCCASLPASAQSGDVVSIGGDITEIVWALGQAHRLAACDTSSIYPASVTESLPKVGYMRALSAEGVVSVRPQLVIASNNAGPDAALKQLGKTGIEIHRVNADPSLSAVTVKIAQVAEALGVADKGDELIGQFQSRLQRGGFDPDNLQMPRNDSAAAPKVLFILGHGGGAAMVAGRDSAADSIIRLAGGANAFSDFSGYKPMTAEAVIKSNPDIILVTTQSLRGDNDYSRILKLPGVSLTAAGRSKHILDYDALLLLGFGLRTPKLLQQLKTDFERIAR